ncbi:MAG: hypothetical protein AAFO02_23135, partial [Bacteroidota bacterium]
MRISIVLVALVSLFSSFFSLQAQTCDQHIADDRIIAGTHILRSVQTTMVVRGNYSYALALMSDDKGITARMESSGGIEFNQDDEVIFMDANQVRRSYRFIGMGEMERQGGIPVHTNLLQLDMTALQWFSDNNITTIYLKNNISNEMRKFTLTSNRLQAFNTMARCFYQVLDPNKVVDKGEAGLLIPSANPGARTSSAAPSGTGGANTGSRPAAPTSDDELVDLRRQLSETKDRLRNEIDAERRKADQVKSNLQEEVAAAREQAAQQKQQYADEVLEARQQAQKAIQEAQASSAEAVQAARQKA